MNIKKFDLGRFIKAHEVNYPTALNEIKNGRKVRCWIWYIFPQLRGLGRSHKSIVYGIDGIEEAKAYLAEPILEEHLRTISQALLSLNGRSLKELFRFNIDITKLRSCMTLFAIADPNNGVYQAVLDKYFEGEPDDRTIKLLNRNT